MKLRFCERTYPFRSRGLFVFLRILQDAHPGWVDMAAVESRLPGIDPRQLARFVDLLEATGLTLVRYETKTRGRFQLAVDPESISFSGDQWPNPEEISVARAPFSPIVAIPLTTYHDKAWVAWLVALMHSTLALHSGQLSGKDGALFHLDSAEAATSTLPLWTVSVVHVRRAIVLERESRYREASSMLRRIDTVVRLGRAHPAANARTQLVRAKMRYDQARYPDAERFLGLSSAPGGSHDPYWLNMNALISGRKFLTANDADAPALLAHTLSALTDALGGVFLGLGDSSLLDALCYNFGNNLLRGIKRGLIPETCADTVMQWLACNMLVCRKLGIGDDSVLTNLLLIDVGLEHGYSVAKWPQLLRSGLNFPAGLGELLTATLALARQTGNRLEIAQCLRRKVRLATTEAEAKYAYFEAVEIFGEQGRNDIVHKLPEEWGERFGRSPPKLLRGHGIKIK